MMTNGMFSQPSSATVSTGANVVETWAGVPTVQAEILDLGGQVNNILAFGAVGDGVTDSTAAIQAAINAGGITFVPAGTFVISSPLTPLSGTCIKGVGFFGVGDVTPPSSNYSTITITTGFSGPAAIYANNGQEYVVLEDICLDGHNVAGGIDGILLSDQGGTGQECEWKLHRTYVRHWSGQGIQIGSNWRAFHAYHCFVGDNTLNNFNIRGSDTRIDHCQIGGAGQSNVFINNSLCSITQSDVYGATNYGYYVKGTSGLTSIVGGSCDRNQQDGVFIEPGATGVSMTGVKFHSNSQSGNGTYSDIHNQSASGTIVVTNCAFGGLDGGITNACAYAIYNDTGTTPNASVIDIGNTGGTGLGYLSGYTNSTQGYGLGNAGINLLGSPQRIEPFNRFYLRDTNGLSSGLAFFTYFVAPANMPITKILTATRGTASSGASVARVGLYSVAQGSGNLTKIAQSAESHTTLWTTINTVYTTPFDGSVAASVTLQQGATYAMGAVESGASVSPLLPACAMGIGTLAALPPLGSATFGGQLDLPASVAGASVTATGSGIWMACTP